MGVKVRFKLGLCSTRTRHDHFEWGRMKILRTPIFLVGDLKISFTSSQRSWDHLQIWMENLENGGGRGISRIGSDSIESLKWNSNRLRWIFIWQNCRRLPWWLTQMAMVRWFRQVRSNSDSPTQGYPHFHQKINKNTLTLCMQ